MQNIKRYLMIVFLMVTFSTMLFIMGMYFIQLSNFDIEYYNISKGLMIGFLAASIIISIIFPYRDIQNMEAKKSA